MKKSNANLHMAKAAKDDEFYTSYADIENELKYYRPQFRGRKVLCNCNDGIKSNFSKYLVANFQSFRIGLLVFFDYSSGSEEGTIYRMTDLRKNWLHSEKCSSGQAAFDSGFGISILESADIVVTNPPFSRFREFIDLLFKYDKKFLIIGRETAIGYKDIFKRIQDNEMWCGVTNAKTFHRPDGTDVTMGNACWFTNLEHHVRNEELITSAAYNNQYKRYDNYDAINVDKIADIPMGYDGVMGVPITFIKCYNPKQFKIIKFRKGDDNKDLRVDGIDKFSRILIQRRA